MPGVCGRLERKINKASVASELKLPWVCENFGHFASTSGDWRPDCGSKVRWSLCVGSRLELESGCRCTLQYSGSFVGPEWGWLEHRIGFGEVTFELPPPLPPLPPLPQLPPLPPTASFHPPNSSRL